MTELQKQLLVLFLDELGYRYGNDSCNDLRLDQFIPDTQTRRDFMATIDPENYATTSQWYNPKDDCKVVSNLAILTWLLQSLNLKG